MHEERLKFYDANNIDTLPWPETQDGQYAKKYLTPLIKNGTKYYIDNVDTKMIVAAIDDLVLPVTVNDTQYDNCYVCSPYSYFISCALEHIERIGHRSIIIMLRGLLMGLSKFLRWGKVNKIVVVNNWLVSTNLHPDISEDQVRLIKNALQERYPDHVIAFRSVNSFHNSALRESLKKQQFDLIVSRQVYYLDPNNERVFQSRLVKKDIKLLKECEYTVLDENNLTAQDVNRIHELYSALYLEKHSMLNVQLNRNFIAHLINEKLFAFKVLKNGDSIDGVMGYFWRNGVMTSPFFGYDISKPRELGLYRLLATLLLTDAKKRNLLLNLSSGANEYKKWRGGIGDIEYLAVYKKHLPSYRHAPWNALRWILQNIGMPLIKRYEL
jgi:hypothetical protein